MGQQGHSVVSDEPLVERNDSQIDIQPRSSFHDLPGKLRSRTDEGLFSVQSRCLQARVTKDDSVPPVGVHCLDLNGCVVERGDLAGFVEFACIEFAKVRQQTLQFSLINDPCGGAYVRLGTFGRALRISRRATAFRSNER